jgi:hypothetical protein
MMEENKKKERKVEKASKFQKSASQPSLWCFEASLED